MWETLCRGYSVNLQCEDSSCLPCGWSIAWFPQIHADFHRFYMIDKNRNPPLALFVAVRTHKNQDKPLAPDASLLRDLDGAAVWKSLSELRYFQPSTPSPYGFRINRKAINMK